MDNANQNRANARANRRNGRQEHELRALRTRVAGLQTRLEQQNKQIQENAGKDRTFPILSIEKQPDMQLLGFFGDVEREQKICTKISVHYGPLAGTCLCVLLAFSMMFYALTRWP